MTARNNQMLTIQENDQTTAHWAHSTLNAKSVAEPCPVEKMCILNWHNILYKKMYRILFEQYEDNDQQSTYRKKVAKQYNFLTEQTIP